MNSSSRNVRKRKDKIKETKKEEKKSNKEQNWFMSFLIEQEDDNVDNVGTNEAAEKFICNIVTSINMPILFCIALVAVIVCSMFITMSLLGLVESSGKQKNFLGITN